MPFEVIQSCDGPPSKGQLRLKGRAQLIFLSLSGFGRAQLEHKLPSNVYCCEKMSCLGSKRRSSLLALQTMGNSQTRVIRIATQLSFCFSQYVSGSIWFACSQRNVCLDCDNYKDG